MKNTKKTGTISGIREKCPINRRAWMVFLLMGLIWQSHYHAYSNSQDINKYWIGFVDKKNNGFSLDDPSAFLSDRAINRRQQQNIPLVPNDLPVSRQYVDSLKQLNITCYYASKWLNGIVCGIQDSALIHQIKNISFVKEVRWVYNPSLTKSLKKRIDYQQLTNHFFNEHFDYGQSKAQIELVNGISLHSLDYLGEGKLIAVLDAGFYKVNEIATFDSLWMNHQITGTKDFVDFDNEVFDSHPHGMMVLSIMAGFDNGQLIGTAPKADYLLIRTEDASSEHLIEEYNWLKGAEYADSVGADIINSSLGYTEFDYPGFDHAYASLDGNSTIVTRAADMAASKGILVINSAGNEGNDPWKYIVAPADGDSVLSVGAVDANGDIAVFSSYGPRVDRVVKPNVLAVGYGNYIQRNENSYSLGYGTSFAAPIISGMSACLWQAFPKLSNMNIFVTIEQSGSHYFFPGERMGYGIPDFNLAYEVLNKYHQKPSNSFEFEVFPTLFDNGLNIRIYADEGESFTLQIYTLNGRKIYNHEVMMTSEVIHTLRINNLQDLSSGIYVIQLIGDGRYSSKKIVKIR